MKASTHSPRNYVEFRPDLKAGAGYFIQAERLHPTQFAIGWREVVAKKAVIDGKSKEGLIAYFKEKNVPVVIGPGGVPYMTDGHHTTRALIESKQAAKIVYGYILADWSGMEEAAFWTAMQEKNYAFLYDENGRGPMSPAALPVTLKQMRSDPYRGLAWAVMAAGGFKERKDVFYQEFFWAEYFRDKIRWDDGDDTAFAGAVRDALVLTRRPGASALPGYKGPEK